MSAEFFESGLSVIGREPLAMAIARQLREAIVSGKLSDQTPLPSEKELSRRFGVGRSTVREAIRILQAQGLLSGGNTISTVGPSVTFEGVVPNAASALENVLRLGQVPLRDLLELRLLIEREALEVAARVRAVEPLARAETALAEMHAAADDADRFHAADVAFHTALIDAADNRAFSLVMGVMREAMGVHLRAALDEERELVEVLEGLIIEHEAIFDAVSSGKGARAARLVNRHLEGFYEPRLARMEHDDV